MSRRDRMTFGVLLSDLLGRANMTRAELARRLKVGKPIVSKWIDGVGAPRKCVYPKENLLRPMLAQLSADPDDNMRLLVAYAREKMKLHGPAARSAAAAVAKAMSA